MMPPFPATWLVVRGSWWIWTPSQCIVVTRTGRTYHLDVDDGLLTLHDADFQQLLSDPRSDAPHYAQSQSQQTWKQCNLRSKFETQIYQEHETKYHNNNI